MTDRPAQTEDGIEITPEMVEAGVEVYGDYDPEYVLPSRIVSRIYEAMERVRFKKSF